jgi:hypothetical protein
MSKKIIPLFLILIFTFVTISFADEGMWTLDALNQLPWAEMKARGLTLSPADIYNPKGVGLADAIV